MERYFFYCDESGAKGYADRGEQSRAELGVFSGILLSEDNHQAAAIRLDALIEKYRTAPGKLHITDLSASDQEQLRRDVFETILDLGLPCFWCAIHVEGLHYWDEVDRKNGLAAYNAALAHFNSRRTSIKPPNFRHEPRSLHVELFEGLHSRLIAYFLERDLKGVDLRIHTDYVDVSILKKFDLASRELLSTGPVEIRSTGFDVSNQTPVVRTATLEFKLPEEFEFPDVATSTIVVSTEVDGLGLAADVLSNSLLHHFNHRPEDQIYEALNDLKAVAGHPLFESFETFEEWGVDPIADGLYSHPLRK